MTPGPWHASRVATRMVDGASRVTITPQHGSIRPADAYGDESHHAHANATAIAAVPDLVAALVECIDVMEKLKQGARDHGCSGASSYAGYGVETARAALARAGWVPPTAAPAADEPHTIIGQGDTAKELRT